MHPLIKATREVVLRILPRPRVPLAELETVKEVFARRQAELAEHAAGLRAELDAARHAHAEREQALAGEAARLGAEAADLRQQLARERDEHSVHLAERDFLSTQTAVIGGERDRIAGERDRLAARVKDLEEALDVAEGLAGPAADHTPRADEAAAHASPAREGSPLKYIAVGAGRDGTLSLNQMVQFLFDAEGQGRVSMHEYKARDFYDAFCSYRETQEQRHLDHIDKLIADCPYDCIVGNGYAPILPLLAEKFGGKLKLVHLRRADKAACIESLARDCTLFPAAYRYYANDAGAQTKRIAAFHYGEMDAERWDRLALNEKFAWYYDKTHALIDAGKDLFEEYVEIRTEDLDSAAVRKRLATIVLGSDAVVPVPTHLNAHKLDIVNVPQRGRTKMQWLLGRMNLHELASDDVYAVRYFLEKFTAWTGYQITGQIKEISPDDKRSRAEITANLDSARRILLQRLGELLDLRASLEARFRRPARRPRKSG